MRTSVLDRIQHVLGLMIAALACAAASGCVTLPVPSSNYRTDNRLAFPVVASGPASIDGQANDAAWGSGFRFVMEDGGAFPAATLRGVADAGFIYMHAKVEDSNFSDTDVVVIGLNPDNAAGNYRRIHVFPCKPAASCAASGDGSPTPTVEYWTGDFGVTTPSIYTWHSSPAAAAGIVAAAHVYTDPNNASIRWWEVELKVPRAAPFSFVDTNFFGLFVDVVRTDPSSGIAGEAVQYTWPANEFIGSVNENDILSELEGGTLHPSSWGNATLSQLFGNGVRVTELGTNHPTDPTLIQLNAGNVFHATAANFSSNAGTLVAAKKVKATFTIANNGLPALGSWANVPVAGNPTAEADIPPTIAQAFQTGTWNLTPQQVADYTAHPAQCVRVTLSSTDAGTIFTNATRMVNMHFVTSSSPFRERALVGTKGYEPRGDRGLEFTLREKFVNFDPKLKWTTEIQNATKMGDHVYRAVARPGSEHALGITVEPPRMTIPSETVRLPAGTGGRERPPVELAVRPGEVLTFIGSGSLRIGGQAVTAAGAPVGERHGERRLKDQGPGRIGAALGSFDGFNESAFVLGNASTVIVPAGARVLHIKVNDDPDQYAKQQGEGYVFQVVRTAAEPWMRTSNPELGRRVHGDDVFATLGANLPTWLMRGERDTGRYIRIGKKSFRVFESVGSWGYWVRRIH